jgi:hypothetical protein
MRIDGGERAAARRRTRRPRLLRAAMIEHCARLGRRDRQADRGPAGISQVCEFRRLQPRRPHRHRLGRLHCARLGRRDRQADRGPAGTYDSVNSAAFSPDAARIVTASADHTARVWDVEFATMPLRDLVAEVCLRRLRGRTTLTRDEMRLAGYPDDTTEIDVCAGIE